MNYDAYLDKVLSRLLTPGVGLMVVGAVMGYASGKLAALLVKEEKPRETVSLVIKGIGAAIALVGAVLIFRT